MIYKTKEFANRLLELDKKYPNYEVFIEKQSNNKPYSYNGAYENIGFRVDKEKKELYILI